MKEFNYTIRDEIGIHARPAGLLIKKAKEFESEITMECKGKTAAATKLIAIMSLGAKKGDNVRVRIEGADEERAAKEILAFFEENL